MQLDYYYYRCCCRYHCYYRSFSAKDTTLKSYDTLWHAFRLNSVVFDIYNDILVWLLKRRLLKFVYTCSCNVRLAVDNVNASRYHESYSLLFRRQVDINLQRSLHGSVSFGSTRLMRVYEATLRVRWTQLESYWRLKEIRMVRIGRD